MTALFNIAVINAITVLPLAVLAYAISRLAQRPAVTHALWVVVLLKFVTPPLFQLPVTIEMPIANRAVVEANADPVDSNASAANVLPVNATGRDQSHSAAGRNNRPVVVSGPSATNPSAPLRRTSSPSTSGSTSRQKWGAKIVSAIRAELIRGSSLPTALLGIWLGGAAIWLTVQMMRAVRFQRRIGRAAFGSAEIQKQTEQLARQLRLRSAPRVLIVNAALSPMLWGCGSRARLLFPLDLAVRLDVNARATLLTHELAHYGRGDHWVRLLELIVSGLFWWHPVVWWARLHIEESEEECCDAWVVGEFPTAPRQYAEALLDTIDYLCETRRPLPPVASGLGQANFLRRRLTKIMHGAVPKSLTRRSRCAIALVAAMFLPLQPFVFGSASIASLQPIRIADVLPSPTPESVESITDDTEVSVPLEPAPAPPVAKIPKSQIRASRGARVWSTAASPDGRFVLRTTTARQLILTDIRTNREFDLSDQQITAVTFAFDFQSFLAAGSDGRITLWNAKTGQLVRTVHRHSDSLRSIAISPDGETVAAGGRDGSVLLFELNSPEHNTIQPTFSSPVNCVRFSPDGRQLAVAIGDWASDKSGEVLLLDLPSGKMIETLPCAVSPGAVSFASNEELIVGLWNGYAQLWNLTSRQVVGSAYADKSVVAEAGFSPDNPALREVNFEAASANVPQSFRSTDSPMESQFGLP